MTSNTLQRRLRNRKRVVAGATRSRLTVFRSNKYVYAQVIDDKAGKTVAAAFGRSAEEVGEKVAKGALAAGTATAVFDRGEYKFHGKVKQVAESARKAGLKI